MEGQAPCCRIGKVSLQVFARLTHVNPLRPIGAVIRFVKKPNHQRRQALGAAGGDGQPPSAGSEVRKRSYSTIAIVAAVIVVFVVLFVGLLDPSSGSLTASARPAHGKELYQKYCVSCHSVEGRGEFNWMYRERAAPALDSSGHAWHHEDAQLLDTILNQPAPDSRMPPMRDVLSREDALDIVAYIKSLWTSFIRDNCQGAKHMKCTSHQ